tara:strand:- start:164 stop:610 length:447 start_codon:yes stop_codon:yes gene_type:complete
MSKTIEKGFASDNGTPSPQLKLFTDEVFDPIDKKYGETYPDEYFVRMSDGSKAKDIQQMMFHTPEFFEPLWFLCEPPESKNDPYFEDIKEVVGFKHESERYGKIYFPDTRYTDRCPSLCWEIISNGIGGQVPVLTYYGFHRILEREAV